MQARRYAAFLSLAAAHFGASIGAFLWSYAVSSAGFDGKPVSWLGRHLAHPLSQALWFPLNCGLEFLVRLPPYLQWLALLLNSVLGSVVLLLLASWGRRLLAGAGLTNPGQDASPP